MINLAAPNFHNTPVHPLRPQYHFRKLSLDPALKPEVAIITPFYNPGPIFEETILSIRQQSFQNFEWIIVNDGSDDPTSQALLTHLGQQEPRVKVIHQANRGPAVARNRAVEAAQADYICQIDTDDLVEPTFIEKCLWLLESYPEYSFCNTYTINFDEQNFLWSKGFEIGERFIWENPAPPQAVIRREAHLAGKGYDETIRYGHEDWDYWLNLASHGYWGYTIPEYLTWYRRRSGTRISETEGDLEKAQAFRAFLRQKYSDRLLGRFPNPQPKPGLSFATLSTESPYHNLIQKPAGTRRVLMLMPWLEFGGSEKFSLDVIEQLNQHAYEFTLCTTLPSDNPWLAEFARFTPDIFNLPNFLKLVDYPRFLLYLIDSRQIDTVYIANNYLGYQLLPFLRAYGPQVAFVDYTHIEEEYWKSGGYPRAAAGYQALLDLNIVSTHHLKQWMIERGAEAERIEVCHTNIDPERWQPTAAGRVKVRAELGIANETPLLLYAGRIVAQKRPRLFAEVIRRLAHEEAQRFVCLVAGDGEDLPFLQQFVRQHQLEPYVLFLGEVSLERMKALQAAADIFFLPSQMEGLSLAIFEAMAMQTTPVSADVGGQKELVTPECGYLIPQGEHEVEEYVAALKHLIESPQERQAMSAASRERIGSYFRLDQMTERMLQLLHQAQHLAETSPRRAITRNLGLECATLAIEYTRLEREAEQQWHGLQELLAREQSQPNSLANDQVIINQLSAEDISQRIPIKKVIKAIGFKIAKQPGFHWLYGFRGWGKKLLG